MPESELSDHWPPEQLMRDLANAPIIPEGEIDDYARNPSRLPPSPAETDALRCISHGMSIEMAAESLGKSPHTIKQQLTSCNAKLAAKNRVHAVAIALRTGLID